jgi:hypothetical protein
MQIIFELTFVYYTVVCNNKFILFYPFVISDEIFITCKFKEGIEVEQ